MLIFGPNVCDCCERTVGRIHWMDFDNDLSWLCDECMESALDESREDQGEEPSDPTEAGLGVEGVRTPNRQAAGIEVREG